MAGHVALCQSLTANFAVLQVRHVFLGNKLQQRKQANVSQSQTGNPAIYIQLRIACLMAGKDPLK